MPDSSKPILFVGSYSASPQPSIYSLRFDQSSGELSIVSRFAGIKNPSFLAVHPNGRFLYAVSEIGQASDGQHGAVWAFSINPHDHTLEKLNTQSTRGDWPCHSAFDQNGRFLVASNYGSGSAVIFPVLEDGRLGEMVAIMQHEGSGANPDRQEGPHAHSAIFSPDNRYIFVADLGIDQVMVYQFDAQSGSVQKHQAIHTHSGAGPRHMVFHPNGRILYVANELDNMVIAFVYDPLTGTLTPLDTYETLRSRNANSFVADIHMSTDGAFLHISNRGDNSISTFQVARNGRLSLINTSSCEGNWPRNFALSPNGRFMLVANRRSNAISVLPIGEAGKVGTAVFQLSINEPSCIQFL